jgi:hypothetical protein
VAKVGLAGTRAVVSRPAERSSQQSDTPEEHAEIIEIDPPAVSKELKKRWSHFIRKVYETDPLTCPKCQGEMRIISFIDLSACPAQAGHPEVIKKILQHLGLWEESHAPPDRSQKEKEITFDPSYSQVL